MSAWFFCLLRALSVDTRGEAFSSLRTAHAKPCSSACAQVFLARRRKQRCKRDSNSRPWGYKSCALPLRHPGWTMNDNDQNIEMIERHNFVITRHIFNTSVRNSKSEKYKTNALAQNASSHEAYNVMLILAIANQFKARDIMRRHGHRAVQRTYTQCGEDTKNKMKMLERHYITIRTNRCDNDQLPSYTRLKSVKRNMSAQCCTTAPESRK